MLYIGLFYLLVTKDRLMKVLINILIFSCCLVYSSQDNLEITGNIVNRQNIPVKNATISFPSAFLRTTTSMEGKFNLSLVNINYVTSDVIEISNKVNNEILKLTIKDYLKLESKVIVMDVGIDKVAENRDRKSTRLNSSH